MMLRRSDARVDAGGISVTFTTAKSRSKSDRKPKSSAVERGESIAPALASDGDAKASKAAALDPPTTTASASLLPSSSPSPSLFASAASSVGVYAGLYWWILVITAGIAPTLWSAMALCWHLGDCPTAWACLAASGVYWVRRRVPFLSLLFQPFCVFSSFSFYIIALLSISAFEWCFCREQRRPKRPRKRNY